MSEEERKPAETPTPAPPGADEKLLRAVNENLLKLSLRLEQMNLAELVEVTQKPFRLMWLNFLAGITRGIGLFLGAGLMGAITIALITWLVYHVIDQLNWLPVIGQFTHAVGDMLKQFLESHPKK